MSQQDSSVKNEIVVRECSIVNGMLTGFIFILFFGVLFTYLADNENSFNTYVEPFAITATLGLISLKNTISRRVIMRINNKGIFYGGKLITDWEHFSVAYVTDVSKVGSISDRLQLVVQYYDPALLLMEQRMALSNTQDKSGNEIMEVINNFVNSKTQDNQSFESKYKI